MKFLSCEGVKALDQAPNTEITGATEAPTVLQSKRAFAKQSLLL